MNAYDFALCAEPYLSVIQKPKNLYYSNTDQKPDAIFRMIPMKKFYKLLLATIK